MCTLRLEVSSEVNIFPCQLQAYKSNEAPLPVHLSWIFANTSSALWIWRLEEATFIMSVQNDKVQETPSNWNSAWICAGEAARLLQHHFPNKLPLPPRRSRAAGSREWHQLQVSFLVTHHSKMYCHSFIGDGLQSWNSLITLHELFWHMDCMGWKSGSLGNDNAEQLWTMANNENLMIMRLLTTPQVWWPLEALKFSCRCSLWPVRWLHLSHVEPWVQCCSPHLRKGVKVQEQCWGFQILVRLQKLPFSPLKEEGWEVIW